MSPQAVSIEELNIPKASAQAAGVLQLLNASEPDFPALGVALMGDPVLAGELLRYANSPLFRRATEVSNVPTALRLLGLKNVRSAVVMATLNAALPVDSPVAKDILAHLVSCATLCRLIAQVCCHARADDLALLGLVHDVGMIVLATNFSTSYEALLARAIAEAEPLDVLETEVYGFSRAELALRVCRTFRLPALYGEVLVNLYRQPEALEGETLQAWAVLGLAHHLLPDSGLRGGEFRETLPLSLADLQALLDLSDAQREQIIVAARTLGHGD